MINLNDLLEEIEKIKQENLLIIVEGKKDKLALEKIGFSNIFVLNEDCKSIYEKIEEIIMKNEKCIILTDFDKKGKKMYELTKNQLIANGIKMNNKLRLMLLKSHLSHIEGLATFLKHMKEKKLT